MNKTMIIPNVTLSVGATVNIGNYQSVRVGLSMSLPVNKNFKTTVRTLQKEMDKQLKECINHYIDVINEIVRADNTQPVMEEIHEVNLDEI
jgi:hypothetical protein